ncbi:hypothetical protein ACHHYP_05663 [Achlya hypogyna]|uniref:Transmembrane protein n=1 Tax=Achlya hypogyna TaxID=1202772 RepID=A0A1V9YWS3_ACHHY|nr:hypothetical protein ACHHYP_05663 [Achlya hypogyna]
MSGPSSEAPAETDTRHHEPTRAPAEWDGMLVTKVKAAQDTNTLHVNPLTPYMLTPFNTPYCDPTLLVQRLNLSQPDHLPTNHVLFVSNTACPYIPSERPSSPRTVIANVASFLDKCLPEGWQWFKEWHLWIIQTLMLLGGCCMGIPIACFLVLCSPILLFGAVCTSPCWVSIGLWYYHGPKKSRR